VKSCIFSCELGRSLTVVPEYSELSLIKVNVAVSMIRAVLMPIPILSSQLSHKAREPTGCYYFLSGHGLPSQLQHITDFGQYQIILLDDKGTSCVEMSGPGSPEEPRVKYLNP